MAEFIQVGDLHLSDAAGTGGLSKYVPNSDRVILAEVDKVTDYARSNGVRHIILAGDLCDNARMSYEAQEALDDTLEKHQDIVWHILLGNHDMFSLDPANGHSLQMIQRLHRNSKHVRLYFEPTVRKIQGVAVNFLPYPHTSFKRGTLNVFHNEVSGSKNDAGKVFDGDALSKSKAVALGGHLHTAHRVRNTWYSGTLYQTNFGERLPKFFHHVDYNSDQDYDVKLVPHEPVYKLHNVVLNTRQDLEDIPQGDTNLVKLIIQDGCDVNPGDYASKTNIVEVKNFKTKEDLVAVLTEDLSEGHSVVFDVRDFFKVWIDSYDVPDPMRKRIKATRRRVLNSVKVTK